MIYLDACALVKFVKQEAETDALREWRESLDGGTELLTSALAELELTRTFTRAGVDVTRVSHYTGQALRGIHLVDLTTTVLNRAIAYRIERLGSLDAIHLATADPFRDELTGFVTYDLELSDAARSLGFPVVAPERGDGALET